MTALQLSNEKTSIDAFVDETIKKLHARGDDAGTTVVMIAAVRAAADMAPRLADGSIDREVACIMLRRAAVGLGRIR